MELLSRSDLEVWNGRFGRGWAWRIVTAKNILHEGLSCMLFAMPRKTHVYTMLEKYAGAVPYARVVCLLGTLPFSRQLDEGILDVLTFAAGRIGPWSIHTS